MASGIYIDYSRYYSLSQILPASHALKYIYLSNFNAIKRIIAIRQFIKVHELEEKSKIIIINIHSIYLLFDDPGVRLWSAGCRSRFQGWLGRLNFMKSPFCLIDVITVRKDAGKPEPMTHHRQYSVTAPTHLLQYIHSKFIKCKMELKTSPS